MFIPFHGAGAHASRCRVRGYLGFSARVRIIPASTEGCWPHSLRHFYPRERIVYAIIRRSLCQDGNLLLRRSQAVWVKTKT